MQKILISFILFTLFSNFSFADSKCDWSQIKALPDGGYEYNSQLNLCVGQLVQNQQIQQQQLTDLNKAIQLKDLALTASDQRATLWNNTASNMENRLQKIDTETKKNDWLFFGLGVLTTVGAGFMAASLIHK